MAALIFLLDGVNFLNFGVHVSKASGLFSIPKIKERVVGDWQNSNGKIYDTSVPFFNERTITLDCTIEATSRIEAHTKINQFKNALILSGLRRLVVQLEPLSPESSLIFNVLYSGELNVTNSFESTLSLARFSLTLIEPEPRKRVYKVVSSGYFVLSFTCTNIHNVYSKATSYLDRYGSVYISEEGVANDLISLCGDPADLSLGYSTNLQLLYSV